VGRGVAASQKWGTLAQFPYIGKSYDQIRPGLRGLLLVGYIVFYQGFENEVEILRVVSGYRNFQDIFQNE
jgi:toxin ParE1/3/4